MDVKYSINQNKNIADVLKEIEVFNVNFDQDLFEQFEQFVLFKIIENLNSTFFKELDLITKFKFRTDLADDYIKVKKLFFIFCLHTYLVDEQKSEVYLKKIKKYNLDLFTYGSVYIRLAFMYLYKQDYHKSYLSFRRIIFKFSNKKLSESEFKLLLIAYVNCILFYHRVDKLKLTNKYIKKFYRVFNEKENPSRTHWLIYYVLKINEISIRGSQGQDINKLLKKSIELENEIKNKININVFENKYFISLKIQQLEFHLRLNQLKDAKKLVNFCKNNIKIFENNRLESDYYINVAYYILLNSKNGIKAFNYFKKHLKTIKYNAYFCSVTLFAFFSKLEKQLIKNDKYKELNELINLKHELSLKVNKSKQEFLIQLVETEFQLKYKETELGYENLIKQAKLKRNLLLKTENKELKNFAGVLAQNLDLFIKRIKSLVKNLKSIESKIEQERLIKRIQSETQNAKLLISKILDFARLKSKPVTNEILVFNEVLTAVIANFKSVLDFKKKQIVYNKKKADTIQFSKSGLYQLITNLIEISLLNLMDSEESIVEIKTSIENQNFVLILKNYGKKISAEEITKLNASNSNLFENKLTLYFYICKEIANMNNGNIKIEHQPKAGFNITLKFPVLNLTQTS